MALSIDIEKYRLSLFRTEIHHSLFSGSAGNEFQLGFIGSRPDYVAAVDKIQAGDTELRLTVPWEGPVGHHYWEYYLQGNSLEYLSGEKAWKFIVPLRGMLPVTITTPNAGDRVHVEVIVYPFGIALSLTLVSQTARSLEATIDHAAEFKRDTQLTVQWDGKEAKEMTLNGAFEECMGFARHAVLNAKAQPDRRSGMFTVFTIVKGQGADATRVPADGDEIHRALDAVTAWPPDWREASLPALDEKVCPEISRSDPKYHLVYAGRRGRAVWFPALFASKKPKRGASCYHRNLTFASMQTSSLAEFAASTAESIDNGAWAALPATHRECARLAAGILGRIYGKTRDTYQSKGLRYLIDQNDLVAPINTLRDQVMMGKLA